MQRSADDHSIGGRQTLEARCHVRRLAQGKLLASAACSHLTHHHRTSMNPNADSQSNALLLLQAGGKCPHGLDHRQSCPHGALRVVFVRQRIAKVDQQAIPQVLGNVPIEAPDDRDTGGLVGPHRGTVVLWVELPGQRCGGHQVAEQDGELAAFRLRGRWGTCRQVVWERLRCLGVSVRRSGL
jgi:hypothetical protein